MERRLFVASALGAFSVASAVPAASPPPASGRLKMSLAQWSLHKAIQSRLITNQQFPRIAREQFGIEGLEFVNTLMEPPTESALSQLKKKHRRYRD